MRSEVKEVRGQVPDKEYTDPRKINLSALFSIVVLDLVGGRRLARSSKSWLSSSSSSVLTEKSELVLTWFSSVL